jgi:hypothetical protein
MRARLFASLLAVGLCGPGCASSQALTRDQARALGERRWDAPTDEVFDATWLTLRGQGYAIGEVDRVAGTLVAAKAGHTWELDVAARGADQLVRAVPREDATPRGELVALLDALEEGTRRLVRAWRELPEWRFDGRRNLLAVPGFSAAPPREWEWLDLDVSRRQVVVQQHRARSGLNPTLVVELDRRRPQSALGEALKKAAGLALGARQRLTLPDELDSTEDASGLHGRATVLDGTLPQDVSWHALEVTLGTTDVRWVMVCPRAAERDCTQWWAALAASVVR